MTTKEMRNKIDQLWTHFWTGGITNPFTVIEQITFLMFSRLLDIKEKNNERKAKTTGEKFTPIFNKNEQHLRWDNFRHESDPQKLLQIVRDEVFPHFKRSIKNGSTFSEYMKDAQLMIVKPSLLVTGINTIQELPLTQGDVKGDLYEYLLSKLQQSGIAGQFRTPRHIIDLMVQMLDPQPTHRVCDPACGTAGFLVGTKTYLDKKYTTPGMEKKSDDDSIFYPGDQLFDYKDHIQNELLTGFDFDSWELDLLADYIEKKHHRYVEAKTPELKQYLAKLCKVHGENHPELFEINEQFNRSAGELAMHMKKEELILFPYVRKMATAKQKNEKVDLPQFGTVKNPIQAMMQEHNNEGERFKQIAEISNNYTPPADGCNTYRVAFSLLKEFEEDLHLHIHLENNILFPKSIEYEKMIM